VTYNPSDLPHAIANNILIDALDHWVWGGNYHPDGLPLIGSKMAHSAIYKYLTPDLPKNAGRIFRTCGLKSCVNPAHMRCPSVDNGILGRLPKVQKVQSVEKDAPNISDLVKVLQRIAEVLEREIIKTTGDNPPENLRLQSSPHAINNPHENLRLQSSPHAINNPHENLTK